MTKKKKFTVIWTQTNVRCMFQSIMWNKFSMNFDKPNRLWQHTTFHSSPWRNMHEWMQMFLTAQTTVTLNEDQGHAKWQQNVAFSGLYDHAKSERNQTVNVRMRANIENFILRNNIVFSPLHINWMRSSSSAFPSCISGVHHFRWDFCICDHFVIQP